MFNVLLVTDNTAIVLSTKIKNPSLPEDSMMYVYQNPDSKLSKHKCKSLLT